MGAADCFLGDVCLAAFVSAFLVAAGVAAGVAADNTGARDSRFLMFSGWTSRSGVDLD
jgi:hypothetical protein